MKNKFVTIGAIQSAVGEDMQANIEKTVKLVEHAAKGGAQIICLQELYNTPYFPQYQGLDKEAFTESIPGNSTEVFAKIAKQYGVVIIVPIYEKAKDKNGKVEYHNSAVVIDEKGKLLETYRKIHIPHDPGFYEKEYFKESDSGYKIYKTKFATFAVLICFDQWFPEAARTARLGGAEIIFYPTAIGNVMGYKAEDDWHDAWEVMQRSHAIANSLYVVAVNRVGTEGKIKFFGQSFVASPFGKVIKRAGEDKEEMLLAKLDLERNKLVAEDWGFLRNRRPDTYGVLTTDKLIDKSKNLKSLDEYKKLQKSLQVRKIAKK
ncbi:MAG: carbon-nitrogen hydrolase [bacterium]|nr:carbon-nitrogen hydrolase [bacterium]